MKFLTLLFMFKNIIILIWWLIVLIIFKVTINFEFSNGNSLIFIALLIIPPIVLYVYGKIYKKYQVKLNKIKKEPYFNLIKKDLDKKVFKIEFLDKLIGYNVLLNVQEEFINLSNDYITISFNKNFACIIINNTNVIYKYFYSSSYKNYTKYDERLFKYKTTIDLYESIINKLELLANKNLLYFENKKGCILLNKKTNEVLYTTFKKTKKIKDSKNTKDIVIYKV